MLKKYGRKIFLSLLMGIWIAFCCEVGAQIGAAGDRKLGMSAICARLALKSLLYAPAAFLAWELPARVGAGILGQKYTPQDRGGRRL